MSVVDAALERDRWIVGAALAGITAVAWAYMVHEARAMSATGVCACMGMQMSGPDVRAWDAGTLLPLFAMWAEMMVAMMLPSAAPMILIFSRVSRQRREGARPFVPVAYFAGGYFAVWTLFSAAAALLQWLLHGATLISPAMATSNRWLGAGLLLAAAIFQWTPLKRACLEHCRSPLAFVMTGWREGRAGAFAMGWRHGLYCTGCCWVLMLLLFVAGVMNLVWIAALSLLVLGEKLAPRAWHLDRWTGAALLGWALFIATGLA